jgi:hypothetical protein
LSRLFETFSTARIMTLVMTLVNLLVEATEAPFNPPAG